MIPNLIRHDEWFDLSVFLELVVREVERENCEKFVRIPYLNHSNSLELNRI